MKYYKTKSSFLKNVGDCRDKLPIDSYSFVTKQENKDYSSMIVTNE